MNTATATKPTNHTPPSMDGRDLGGRFANGNAGGPGNPYPRRMAAFRRALLNCVSEEDIIAITRAVIEEAKNGNVAAAKLLFQYVFGKPGPAAAMDFNEGSATPAEELSQLLSAMAQITPDAPIGNGSNGEGDEAKSSSAPIANGSNGEGDGAKSSSAPIANGSNGEVDEAKSQSAPIGNGSNGGSPDTIELAPPTGSPRKLDPSLERQVQKVMETLGDKLLVDVSTANVAVVNSGAGAQK
jgi:hypothetical protein